MAAAAQLCEAEAGDDDARGDRQRSPRPDQACDLSRYLGRVLAVLRPTLDRRSQVVRALGRWWPGNLRTEGFYAEIRRFAGRRGIPVVAFALGAAGGVLPHLCLQVGMVGWQRGVVRRQGRGRLPIPKSRGSLMVVSVRSALRLDSELNTKVTQAS